MTRRQFERVWLIEAVIHAIGGCSRHQFRVALFVTPWLLTNISSSDTRLVGFVSHSGESLVPRSIKTETTTWWRRTIPINVLSSGGRKKKRLIQGCGLDFNHAKHSRLHFTYWHQHCIHGFRNCVWVVRRAYHLLIASFGYRKSRPDLGQVLAPKRPQMLSFVTPVSRSPFLLVHRRVLLSRRNR